MLAERARALTGSQTSGNAQSARKLRAEAFMSSTCRRELDQDTSSIIKGACATGHRRRAYPYTDTLGIRELRERLAQRVTHKTGVAYSADEVGSLREPNRRCSTQAFVAFSRVTRSSFPLRIG